MSRISPYRALIVDDEAIACKMLAFALQQEGFHCDLAGDGTEASDLIAERSYDLVVTDLLMPHRNGHSLAVEVLSNVNRPVLIVHTSVDDPRLTKDLLIRGVDDIVYKPTNYATFAARAAALIERREALRASSSQCNGNAPGVEAEVSQDSIREALEMSREAVENRLAEVSSILPVSETALSVYQLATEEDAKAADIAKEIKDDAALAADILRAGNSAHYNRSGKPVSDLEQLVIGIGSRRVSELALAASARSLVTRQQVPWLDVDLAWKRSVAAGMALDALVAQGGHECRGTGLFLSAIMYPLGRIVLANLFPLRHEALTKECEKSGEALAVAEKRVFFRSNTEIMAELLTGWKIPADVSGPLRHASSPYSFLRTLPNEERATVELVKISVLLGRLAVGIWEPWDQVEIPPAELLTRLRIRSLREILAAIRSKIEKLEIGDQSGSAKTDESRRRPNTQAMGYWKASRNTFDFLAALCPALGVKPVPSELDDRLSILVNGFDVEPSQPIYYLNVGHAESLLAVTSERDRGRFAHFGQVIALPSSFQRLQQAVRGLCPQKVATVGVG